MGLFVWCVGYFQIERAVSPVALEDFFVVPRNDRYGQHATSYIAFTMMGLLGS